MASTLVYSSDDWRCIACGVTYARHLAVCYGCFRYSTLAAVGVRRRAAIDEVPATTTARQIARMTWSRIGSAAYPDLALGSKAFVLISGGPGSGKSSMASRLVGSLDGFPPVCLHAAEEGLSQALAARLGRLGLCADRIKVCGRGMTVDGLVTFVREERCRALVIDSVQEAVWQAHELRHVLSVLPDLDVVVGVSQINGNGLPAGQPSALRHEADVHIECEALRWTCVKSRYQALPVGGVVLSGGGAP